MAIKRNMLMIFCIIMLFSLIGCNNTKLDVDNNDTENVLNNEVIENNEENIGSEVVEDEEFLIAEITSDANIKILKNGRKIIVEGIDEPKEIVIEGIDGDVKKIVYSRIEQILNGHLAILTENGCVYIIDNLLEKGANNEKVIAKKAETISKVIDVSKKDLDGDGSLSSFLLECENGTKMRIKNTENVNNPFEIMEYSY